MDYISTRDRGATGHGFTDILLAGLAPDGGLYLPERYPKLGEEDLERLRGVFNAGGYPALAAAVFGLFVDDIEPDELVGIARRAYNTEAFAAADEREIVPVSEAAPGIFLAHLSQGPTAAFKDIAMQALGEFFEFELARRGEYLTILGATSGDTGSSAEYAMRGRENISVFMLTPKGRMTEFQQAQMFGLDDKNIHNIALDGVFDDCQDVVKEVSADAEFKAAHRIGAVNSINWARLMAQIVYYLSSWLQVASQPGEKVSFSVPTGNFGDVFAGHVARQMGVPIDRLIVATNENDVLDEFFRTGAYRPRSAAETHRTSSPSMDISRASNFERLIADATGRDAERVADLFGERLREGGFDLSGTGLMETIADDFGFLSGSSSHADRVRTIAEVYRERGVLIDPHTADGWHVAAQLKDRVDTPIVCLETALPVKFADTIAEAIGTAPAVPERFAGIVDAERRVVDLPKDAEAVKRLIAKHAGEGD